MGLVRLAKGGKAKRLWWWLAGVGLLMYQTGGVGNVRVSQENWVVGDGVSGGMLMGQTGGVGNVRVIVSQESWVVGDGVWGGMLMGQTGRVGTVWVSQEIGWWEVGFGVLMTQTGGMGKGRVGLAKNR